MNTSTSFYMQPMKDDELFEAINEN